MKKTQHNEPSPPEHHHNLHYAAGTTVWLRRINAATPIRGVILTWFFRDNPLRCAVLIAFDSHQLDPDEPPGKRVTKRLCCDAYQKALVRPR